MKIEVETAINSLKDAVVRHAVITREAEEARRRATEVAEDLERVQAAKVRAEIESMLITMIDQLEKEAAIAQAKEEMDRITAESDARVNDEVAARRAAEEKAAEMAQQAKEAMRQAAAAEKEAAENAQAAAAAAEKAKADHATMLRAQEEARVRASEIERQDAARIALEHEAEALRSQLQVAGEEAAERAREEEEAHALTLDLATKQGIDRAERETRLLKEAKERAERGADARHTAELEAQEWKEKFEAAEREREERKAAEKEIFHLVTEAEEVRLFGIESSRGSSKPSERQEEHAEHHILQA